MRAAHPRRCSRPTTTTPGEKEISIWPYKGYEGSAGLQRGTQPRYLAKLLTG